MHALENDGTCAEADGPNLHDAVVAATIAQAHQAARVKRMTRRLTIPEQDKLRDRIARLESSRRYYAVVLVAVALVCLALGKVFGAVL